MTSVGPSIPRGVSPLEGVARMTSRVTRELTLDAAIGKAAMFLLRDLSALSAASQLPIGPVFREVVRISKNASSIEAVIKILELTPREELRAVQALWEEAKTGLAVESRFLPIRDKNDQPFDGVVARLVRFRPPVETSVLMGLFVVPGIIESPAKFIDRWERLARRGFDVFVLEMPGIHTNLHNPIPLEKRFMSSYVASHTLAAAADEARLWMDAEPTTRGLLMGGLLASHSTFMGMESAVVLGHTLPFGAGLAMEGPRIHAGRKYDAFKYRLTKLLAWLNPKAPFLFGRFNFPVSRPKPKPFLPEGDPRLDWQKKLHEAGLTLRSYNGPLVFSVWRAQKVLAKALLAPDGHRNLPKRLRIGIHPNDEEVSNAHTERLMAQIDADPSRPNVERVEQAAHSMGYFPETDGALADWFLEARTG